MPFAGGMAQCFGAKLYAVHVEEPINHALPAETWEREVATREIEIQALRGSIQHEFHILPELLRAEGPVNFAVEQIVRQRDIDLVVIGTHGRSGVGKLLLGSKAEAIIRGSSCPVLTIGPNVFSRARQQGQMRSILFATDFGPSANTAAKFAVSLAHEFKAKIALLHVIGKREANETQMPGDDIENCVEKLEVWRPSGAEAWGRSMVVVEHGAAAEKILEVADERDADLIVMGVHAAEGVPGAATHLSHATVHRVIARAKCPVLTVPPIPADKGRWTDAAERLDRTG